MKKNLFISVLFLTLSSIALGDPTPKLKKKIYNQICDMRACGEVSIKSAGHGPGGENLLIAALTLQQDEQEECVPIEHWLAVEKNRRIVDVQLLAVDCNDGYGAAGIGEDIIEISNNFFSHERCGGSAWRWSQKKALQLYPLEIIEEYTYNYHTFIPNNQENHRDWRNFSFRSERTVPSCESLNKKSGEYEKIYTTKSISIPILKAKNTWDMTSLSLGACGAEADSSGKNGFIIHGKKGSPDDAAFVAMLTDKNELWIEIKDDHWVSGADRWIFDDHLEIWLSGREEDFFCVSEAEKPVQWGVRVTDGKVFPAFGAPLPLTVKAFHADSKRVRMRLALPEPVDRITVVYSDSDDGKTQERLISTSELVYGKLATMGGTVHAWEKAECIEDKQKDAMVVSRKKMERPPREAVIDLY